MYSLNVPVPSEVGRLAAAVARDLPAATARPRGEHTLVVKRLGTGGYDSSHAVEARAREVLRGQPSFRVRVTGLDRFDDPPVGSSPVVYLSVESPGLRALHEHLCDHFGTVGDLEGDDYTPHVTVARGGDPDTARRVCGRDVDPVEWTVDALSFLDAERGHEAGRVALPA